MYGYIYKTTCLITNLIYIGQHKADHFEPEKYIGSGKKLKTEIKLYGKANFICELLDTAETRVDLNLKEKYWIAYYNSLDITIGYNISPGGAGITSFIKLKKDDEFKFVSAELAEQYLANGWTRYDYAAWKADNLEKIKLNQHKHYEKNKIKYLEKGKQHRKEHAVEFKEYMSEYRIKNAAIIKAKNKEYYENHKDERQKYNEVNKERIAKYKKEYNKTYNEQYFNDPKNKKRIAEYKKEYSKSHKTVIKEKNAQYYKEHKEAELARSKKYRDSHREERNRKAREKYKEKKLKK